MIELSYRADIESQTNDLQKKKDEAEELFDGMEADIEELERIKIGEAFGIPKAEMFRQVREYGRKETICMYELTADNCQKLVDNDDGTGYILAEKGDHQMRCKRKTPSQPDLADDISIYSGNRPKKGAYNHKGVKIEFDIWKAPNGLWFGDHSSTSCSSSCSINISDVECAFETQKEVFDYCVRRAIETLSTKDVDRDTQEIEVPCPDCVAWAKKHIEVTQLKVEEDGERVAIPGTTAMWEPDKQYNQVQYNLIGCEMQDDEDGNPTPILSECETCNHERPSTPWFDENKIERDETPEETASRIAEEEATPKYGKNQPDIEKLIVKLKAMQGIYSHKTNAAQLELAL
jgi:hypothetical protein